MKAITSLAVLGLAAATASNAAGSSTGSARRAVGADANGSSSSSSSSRHRFGRRIAPAARGEASDMAKRGLSHSVFSGTATHYGASVSRGACGSYVSASDYVVALNTAQYGNENAVSPWCGKSIVINAGGQTITAKVVDACPTCSFGDLDMSTGLFTEFASLSDGVFDMTWHLAGATTSGSNSSSSSSNSNSNDDDDDDTTTTTHHKTHQSTQKSTSTSTPSSSSSPTMPTLMPIVTSLNTTTSSAPALSVPSATLATEAATATAQNLAVMNQALQGMLQMANAGRA